GIPFSSNFLADCLELGAKRIGWKPRPHGPRKLKVNGKYRGMGMACCIYKTGQSNSSAVVKVKADGTVELYMGIMEIGQGAWTVLTQIAAETLGVRFESVKGIFADTEVTPFAHGTSGSTTTFTSGLAALQAAEEAKRQIKETASRLLEVEAGEIEIRDGIVIARSDPEQHLPLGHVVARRKERLVVGQASLRAGSKTHIINSFAAHFTEVEVDPESGAIRVLRYIAAHDSGRAVHPEAAYGQIVGGVVQGLGYALMEEIPLDPESGAPLAMNLDSFKIPNLIDVPVIEPILLNRPDPIGPYGAKALGEPPLVPVAAAIANAVYDATGVRIRELPITAEKVLAGLHSRR
ncbi:MAG: xanthine dehydrogenase family protein molybdopterin-binding subunit, partial [Candidatus Binatia bacterium]